ncbi:MAG TPA: hypothetical protein VD788_08720 [Candidatus Polarisedimenticolaceae bacterium]|nr:hypothetical protein [Candidatus Polarisedimenticolaceae bacterium]
MDLEKLYLALPIPLQNLGVTATGWRIRRRRFDREFRQLWAAYDERTGWDRLRVSRLRDRRLAEFVQRAARDVPHYRELFERLRIDPREIGGLEELSVLPVLTKEEVQRAPERFRSPAIGRRRLLAAHTSGSTGAGLRFVTTWSAHREQWAVWWRYRGWHGLRPGTACLYMGGRSIVPVRQRRPPYWRRNHAGSQTLFSAYHLNSDTAGDYLREMRDSGAPWIHGYPSMVALLASFSLEFGIRVPVRWVTLGAENLLPSQARVIERAFGVEPIEHYGMAEAVANVSMCPERRLHVDEDFAATEFVPDDAGRLRVVGTNFTNPAFPLIRYEVGDHATLDEVECGCGRPGRTVARLDGRLEDYVVTKSGALLGRLDHIFKDLERVREAQIRQSEPGRIVVAVVRGPGWGEPDERRLRGEILKRVGDQLDFDIVYPDSLGRTAREKLRFVISTMERGKLAAPVGRTPDATARTDEESR